MITVHSLLYNKDLRHYKVWQHDEYGTELSTLLK